MTDKVKQFLKKKSVIEREAQIKLLNGINGKDGRDGKDGKAGKHTHNLSC